MRLIYSLVAVLIVGTAAAAIQTLEDMGVRTYVGNFDDMESWEIPYEFNGKCTAFFTAMLETGELKIFDGNDLLIHTKKPGKYRVILENAGVMRIVLKRMQGDREARLNTDSFIACDRVPVVTMEINVPKTWNVGGFTPVMIRLENRGTAEADGVLTLNSPWNAAPITPPKKIHVPAKGEVNVIILMLTVEENNKVLFPRQCFEYHDEYGRSESCVDSTVFAARKSVPVGCIMREEEIELFNKGYVDLELGSEVIPPRKSIFTGLLSDPGEEICAFQIQIQKIPFMENSNRSIALAAIMAVLGIIGIFASEKKLKTSKA